MSRFGPVKKRENRTDDICATVAESGYAEVKNAVEAREQQRYLRKVGMECLGEVDIWIPGTIDSWMEKLRRKKTAAAYLVV